jgi:hypothetical protein
VNIYVKRREAELPVFMEVFKALPEGKLDYKPADDSPSAKEIAWIMTRQLKSCNEIIKDGKTEWDESEAPSWDQVLDKFETWSKELTERASKMSDADWDRKAELYYQGKMMRNDPNRTLSLGDAFRRDPSSRSTVGLSPSNGWEGAGHLRAVRGRQAKEHGDDKLNFRRAH